MKRVKDYIPFDQYESSIGSPVFDYIHKNAAESLNNVNKYSQFIKKFQIWFFLADALLIGLTLVFIYCCFKFNYSSFKIPFILFFILSLILSLIIYYGLARYKVEAQRYLKARINEFELYSNIFNKIEDVEYLGIEFNLEDTPFTKKFLTLNRSPYIPSGATIFRIWPIHKFLISDEFVAYFVCVTWKWVVHNGKTTQVYYRNSGYFNIDIEGMDEDKKFAFSMLNQKYNDKFLHGLKPIKLENPDFNKRFNMHSDNEVRARMLATPLFMEIANQRYNDTKGIRFGKQFISLYATYDYIQINVDLDKNNGIMLLDTKFRGDLTKWCRSIYSDLITDSYSIYFLLSLITISSYI
ncbi:hypothetical protein C4M96_01580 [Mycoplasmopsis pullorum]|uniref:DUF3137 domain-containing protein n=1 Tax=Mycoplasmopsis pullorum TaxID=48003 RepID=UPI00111A2694|nr:DUF3137 domain-containing protein [Mycoplasmopsis pullorum]TNK83531.1 hypothetical protein C4M93_02215 [Mycoplasmopsis pullorum]TNK92215.1 hypothetical protein C4M96_01580 [Mycoplasmopsis pullorum]